MGAGSQVTLDLGGPLKLRVDQAAVDALIESGGAVYADGGFILIEAQAAGDLSSTVINHTGILEAQTIGTDDQGRIALKGDSAIEVSGTLTTQAPQGTGGTITVEAEHIHLTDTADIDATGATGGGNVLIGGDWQGGANAERRVFVDPDALKQATTVVMEQGAVIDASATDNGDGGTVVLWSDIHNPDSVTQIYGELLAEGGDNGGDGGQIETSGFYLDALPSNVSASAANGERGEWLLDPYNITIASSGTSVSGDYTPSADSTILASSIVTALNAGTNVTVSTGLDGSAGSSVGNITVNSAINATTANGGDLTLEAARYIVLNADLTTAGSITFDGDVKINAETVSIASVNNGSAGVNITFTGDIDGATADSNSLFMLSGAGAISVAGGVGANTSLALLGLGGTGGKETLNQTFSTVGATTYTATFSGVYTLEVWGAQGGSVFGSYAASGGKGGRAKGDLELSKGDEIHIYVGGKGTDNNSPFGGVKVAGGFNGGGAVTSNQYASSGGGATDIRFGGDGLANRVIVAGGGGGAGGLGNNEIGFNGGHGGSSSGQSGSGWSGEFGAGGSQNAGGAGGTGSLTTISENGRLGIGGSYVTCCNGGAGGGGGYYGGGAGSSAGGGSNYIGGVTGSTLNQRGVQTGNGKAVITAEATVFEAGTQTGSISIGGSVNVGSLETAGTNFDIAMAHTSGNVTIGSDVTFNNTGNVQLGGVASGQFVSVTGELDASAASLTKIGADITTDNAQTYAAAELLGNATLSTTNSAVNVNGAMDSVANGAHDLTINAGSGAINLSGAVGAGAGAGSTAALGDVTLNSTGATTLGGAVTAASVTTNSGGTLAINGGSVTTTGNQSYGETLTLGADTTFETADLTAAAINLSSHTLTVEVSGTGAVNGIISGNGGGLTKDGEGGLTLSGDNTYSGATVINAGTLVADHVDALGSTSGNTTVNTGGTLDLSNVALAAEPLVLAGGTLIDATHTFGGTIELSDDSTFDIQTGGTLTVSGLISGTGRLTKVGDGTVVLSNASNSYEGGTAIEGGVLSISADGNLGATPGSVEADNLTIAGGTLKATAGFTLNSNRGISLGAGGGTIEVGSAQTFVIDGVVADAAGLSAAAELTKTGNGTLVLAGENTYSGGTTIDAGTVQVGNGLSSGSLGTGAIENNATLVFARTGELIISTVISGSGGLTQAGTGTLTLTGENIFGGNVLIDNGTLVAADNSALGNGASAIDVSVGATLGLQGDITLSRNIDLADGSGVGTIRNVSGDNTLSGTIELATGDNDIVADAGTLSLTGAINAESIPGFATFPNSSLTLSGAGGVDFSQALKVIDFTSTVTDLTLGSDLTVYGNTNGIGVLDISSNLKTTGDVIIYNRGTGSSTIDISGDVTADGNLTLMAWRYDVTSNIDASDWILSIRPTALQSNTSPIILSGKIQAAGLVIANRDGNDVPISIANPTNEIDTVAVEVAGDLTIRSATALTIGTVTAPTESYSSTGITASGDILIETLDGDLTVSEDIVSSSSAASVVLVAGKDIAAGTSTGGDIKLTNGATITLNDSDSQALLYTGSLLGSAGVAESGDDPKDGLVAFGLERFRYNANRATDFTTDNWTDLPETGFAAIYREQPIVVGSVSSATMTYGDEAPTEFTFSGDSGYVNGDNPGVPTVVGVDDAINQSSVGFLKVKDGGYTVTLEDLGGLGYNLDGVQTGTLTVNPLASVTWVGSNNEAWSDPTKWARSDDLDNTGILPDGQNVTLALIPSDFSGTVISNTDSDFTGNIRIEGGTLSVEDDSHLGVVTDTAVADRIVLAGGTLEATAGFVMDANRGMTLAGGTSSTIKISGDETLTYGGTIAGSGDLTKAGAGTLTLSGAHTYTGATTISDGTLMIANDAPNTASSGFEGAGLLRIEPSSNDFSGTFSTSAWSFGSTLGGLTIGKQGNTAKVHVDNALDIAGPISLFSADIDLAANITSSGLITLDGAVKLLDDLTLTGSTVHFNSTVSGRQALTVDGNAIFAGNVGAVADAELASLSVAGTTELGGSITTSGAQTFTGATTLSGNHTLTGFGLNLAGITLDGHTLLLMESASGTVSGVVQDGASAGGITLTGPGSISLTENGTYTGATIISAGTLVLFNNAPTTASSGFEGAGLLRIEPTSDDFTGVFSTTGWTFGSDLGGLTIGKASNTAKVTVDADVAISGPMTIFAGDVAVDHHIDTTAGASAGHIQINAAGSIALAPGKSITAAGGNIALIATLGATANDAALSLASTNITTTDSGTITLTGDATHSTSNQYGLKLGDSRIQSEHGAITITGTGSRFVSNPRGLFVLDESLHVLSASGAITLVDLKPADSLGSYRGPTLNAGIDVANGLVFGADDQHVTSSSSDVTLRADQFTFYARTRFNTAGEVLIESVSDSFDSTQFDSTQRIQNLQLPSTVSGLTIGKATNTTRITFGSQVSLNGPITVYGGDIAIDAALNAASSTINLHASGNVTQTAALNAAGLGLHGTGNFTLNNTANSVSVLAGGDNNTALGGVSFVNTGELTIGSVNPTGITASGDVFVATVTGDLTVSQDISTDSDSPSAIVLAAGTSASAGGAGTPADGNVRITGSPTLTAGTGGTIALYSGDVDGSTGLTSLVGAGTGNFRYNTSINSSGIVSAGYTATLDTNVVNAIYRQQPTITVRVANDSITYGDLAPEDYIADFDGRVNGDDEAAFLGTVIWTTEPSVDPDTNLVDGLSSTGLLKVGVNRHTITVNSQGITNGLGYAVVDDLNASLTVAPKTLTITGLSSRSKVYDGTTTAIVVGTGEMAGNVTGDDVSIRTRNLDRQNDIKGDFDSKDVVDATKVVISDILVGADADNYTYVVEDLDAVITPKTVTLSATKVYDGNTDLDGAVQVRTGVTVGGDTETLSYTNAQANSARVVNEDPNYITSIDLVDGSGANGGLASNYALPELDANAAPVTITPKALTVALNNTGVTKEYDGTRDAPDGFEPSYNLTGFVTGDTAATLTFTDALYNSKDVATASTLTVGGLAVTSVTGTLGSAATDYQVSQTNPTVAATITPKAVTFEATKVYDGTKDLTGAVTVLGLIDGESLVVSGALANDSNVATAGKFIATVNVSDGQGGLLSNYAVPTTRNADNAPVTITPASLTVTAANDAKLLGQDDAAGYAGAFYNGFVSGETVADLGGALSITRTNETTGNDEGTYEEVLLPGGLISTNYDITFENGDYTIVGRDTLLLRSTVTGTQVYGATPSYTFASAQYLDSNDNVVDLSGGISSSGATVTVTEGPASASFDVLPVSGQFSGSGNLRVGGYNVAAGDLTPVLGAVGFSSTHVAGSLSVTPKTVALPVGFSLGQTIKFYDGSTSVAGLDFGGVLTGIETNDLVSLTGAGYFDDRHVGTGKTVTVGLALLGEDAGNYQLPSTTLTNTEGVIKQLDSVEFVGANGASWSDARSWAGGAIPDRKPGTNVDNVLQVRINANSQVTYDVDRVGAVGSAIVNNGRVDINASNAFDFSNTVTGSGVLGQSGAGTVTVSGANTNYTGSMDIGSGAVVLGNANALGASPTLTSNGGTLAFGIDGDGDPLVFGSLLVNGAVTLSDIGAGTTGMIYTTGNQTYNGALTFLSSGVRGDPNADPVVLSVPNFSSANGDITFNGTVSAGTDSKATQRSLVVEALNGTVTFNDQVGIDLAASRDPFTTVAWTSYAGATDINPWAVDVSANRINIFADITTFETQTYNGPVWIGNNGSNGRTRLLLSMNPTITFNDTIDDIDGTHTLIAKAISADGTQEPTLDFNGNIGSQRALKDFFAEASRQDLSANANVADIDTSIPTREDPSLFTGTVRVAGNVRTTGDQSYTAREVNFDPPAAVPPAQASFVTLDHGGVLTITTGLPAPGQPVNQRQVDSFNKLNRIERGANARLADDTRGNPAWAISNAQGRIRRIVPPSDSIPPAQRLVIDGALTTIQQTSAEIGAGPLSPSSQPSEVVVAEVTVGSVDAAGSPQGNLPICSDEQLSSLSDDGRAGVCQAPSGVDSSN
ncbi:autotransporter-associated beta strand repeat-containing protein [Ectothiorhodosinus mongolicus]|nr:autotransporter-associated beta strand repeat-containing protein [Ectothiorhodosinus mongolicus]ULX57831.1 hypothetical protein CKX93_09335 [Ectothiorhodosinus mongolicus]